MIKDRNIAWKTKREFIPVHRMSGFLEATNLITSLGAGTPVLAEPVAAAQLAGMAINAAGNEIFHFWPIPRDMNRTVPFRVRYHFIHTSTDADAPIWKTFYKAIARQQALSAANSSEDEVITHAAHTVSTTANAYEVTVWGLSVSNTKLTADDIAVQFCFECDSLGSASANEINLLGVEIEYDIEATADYKHYTPMEAVASV
jgi:hypothetical protein